MVFVVDETVDGTETVYAFITVEVGTRATIRWLHVDPEARGKGIATGLLNRVRKEFVETPISACVLDEAVEGGNFLKGFGLKESGHDQILLGGEEFDVTMFSEGQKTETQTNPPFRSPNPLRSMELPGPSIAMKAFPAGRPHSSRCLVWMTRRMRTATSVHSAAVLTSPPTDKADSSAGTVATLTWRMSGAMRISENAC